MHRRSRRCCAKCRSFRPNSSAGGGHRHHRRGAVGRIKPLAQSRPQHQVVDQQRDETAPSRRRRSRCRCGPAAHLFKRDNPDLADDARDIGGAIGADQHQVRARRRLAAAARRSAPAGSPPAGFPKGSPGSPAPSAKPEVTVSWRCHSGAKAQHQRVSALVRAARPSTAPSSRTVGRSGRQSSQNRWRGQSPPPGSQWAARGQRSRHAQPAPRRPRPARHHLSASTSSQRHNRRIRADILAHHARA